jgi:hypothetical protein
MLINPDADELAAALERLIARPHELARMQVASRRLYAERFRMQAFAASLHALYLNLGDAGAARRARSVPPRPTLRQRRG